MARLGRVAAAVLAVNMAIAVFERLAPRRWVRAYQRHVGRRLMLGMAGRVPGWALVETTGRRTGRVHRTPVGGRREGDVFWAVGDTRSDYVHNLQADPAVRVRVGGRWRSGVAHVLPDDDARRRLLRMNPLNSLFVLIASKRPVTLRIDLSSRSR